MAYCQVAAAGDGLHQPADDAGRVVTVPDAVQDAQRQDSHRLAEVQRLGGLAEDGLRVTQIGLEEGDGTLRAARQ